jgi:hypothetical protein
MFACEYKIKEQPDAERRVLYWANFPASAEDRYERYLIQSSLPTFGTGINYPRTEVI